MRNHPAIDTMAKAIMLDSLAELDDGRIREDLMGLYSDIRTQLRRSAPAKERLIYEYAALLQEELELHCPCAAYEAGLLLGCHPECADNDKTRAFMSYVRRIESDSSSRNLRNRVQTVYSDLHSALGDAYGLIDEFTVLYRKCCGAVQSKIEVFFDKGYTEASDCEVSSVQ